MRDCPMCYCKGDHCGYHIVPDQFGNNKDLFKELTAQDLQSIAIKIINTLSTSPAWTIFHQILAVQQYLRWPGLPKNARKNAKGRVYREPKVKDKKVWNVVWIELWRQYGV